jgi:Transposase DDE domain/Transposase domain (DUF772)
LASSNLAAGGAASAVLKSLLDSPEIGQLIEELCATRWTGRPGYQIRTMIGLALAKSLYAIPTWTKTVALVADHWKLQRVLGCEGKPPSVWSAYRFASKLRENAPMVERCIDGVVAGLREKFPSYGRDLAIDASDMPAYANGQRDIGEVEEPRRFSDPDAAWGRRSAISTRKGGSFYGYRLHLSACVSTGLPISWRVEPANVYEGWQVPMLLDEARRRGAIADTAAMDRGYDIPGVHADCAARDCLPVIPLKRTTGVKRGDHLPPTCEHGEWTFAGSDRKREAAKWRCPKGKCKPASTWIKADRLHPLIPYKSKRWNSTYRKRVAVEREFGRLKHEWGLKPLRVRGLARVRLHADLTILTKLACALAKARAATARPPRKRGSSRAETRRDATRSRRAVRRE